MAKRGKAGVIVFAFNKDKQLKVLLLQDVHGLKVFCPPKGTQNTNERWIDCALRELFEETGIQRSDLLLLGFDNNRNEYGHLVDYNDNGKTHTRYFIAMYTGSEDNDNDIDNYKFKYNHEVTNVKFYDVQSGLNLMTARTLNDVLLTAMIYFDKYRYGVYGNGILCYGQPNS